ncbi:MAG: N-acetylmuramoyl-L-alanine amidase [Bacteroidales bacterium]
MRVCLDPGHGGDDPGAVDGIDREQDDEIYEDDLYTEESSIVLAVARKLRNLLKDEHTIIMNRGSDKFISLAERVDLANKSEVDIFVSIHANAAANSQAHGIDTLHYPTSTQGKKLAGIIQNKLITKINATNRGLKSRDDLYVLKETDMPSVLVECGFITNPQEEHLLNSLSYQYLLAECIAYGVSEYGDINEL